MNLDSGSRISDPKYGLNVKCQKTYLTILKK